MASETGNENLVNIKKETSVKLVSARERCVDWRIKKRRLDKADWDSALVYLRNRQLNTFPIYSDGKYQCDYVGKNLKTQKDMNRPDFSLFALMSSTVNFLDSCNWPLYCYLFSLIEKSSKGQFLLDPSPIIYPCHSLTNLLHNA